MKIVWVAHPIAGDVAANCRRVESICRVIHNRGVYPIAPYVLMLSYMDDGDPGERAMGFNCNYLYFERGFFDEVWLFGDFISPGMKQEVAWARQYRIPVKAMSAGTRRDLAEMMVNANSES